MSDTQGRSDVAATPDSALAYSSYDPAVAESSMRGRSPGAIEADIAWTRDHLAHTLALIERRPRWRLSLQIHKVVGVP